MSLTAQSPTTSAGRLPDEVSAALAKIDSFRSKVLLRRIERELPTLRSRIKLLYPGSSGDSILKSLLLIAVEHAQRRDAELWSLDLEREPNADWHLQRQTVGYCAYVDRFANNLKGVQSRIDHLRRLGVGYLHLLPFLQFGKAPNDGGFAVADFGSVDPSLGTNEDLVELNRQLRDAGISLCSDLVLNHVSHDHIWAQRALEGDAHYQAYFHLFESKSEVEEYEQSLGQVFPETAPGNFTYVESLQRWAWTTFYPYQWDLNYANPNVLLEMAKATLHLANMGVEAFRLDSTGYLWKRKGTRCINLSEAHWIIQIFRSAVNIACPGVLLKAEAIMPTQELPPYFGMNGMSGKECHLAYHSSLMTAAWVSLQEQTAEVVSLVIDQTPKLPRCGGWMTYVRCHDDIGWNVLRNELEQTGIDSARRLLEAARFYEGDASNSYAAGRAFQSTNPEHVHGTNGMTSSLVGMTTAKTDKERDLAVRRMHLLYSLSFFVGGIPLIYMGDEFGLLPKVWSPNDLERGIDSREIQRPCWDEDLAAQTWIKGSFQNKIFSEYVLLVRARKNVHPSTSLRCLNEFGQSLACIELGDKQLGVFNFSEAGTQIHLESWRRTKNVLNLRDLISGEYVGDAISVPPYGYKWLGANE